MKRTILNMMLVLFLCTGALCIKEKEAIRVQAEVKPEYMQDVPLDEAHFPDKLFRKKLGIYVDENKDGILSREEREEIRYMLLSFPLDGKSGIWYDDMKYLNRSSEVEGHWREDKIRCVLRLDFNNYEENPQIVGSNNHLVDLTGVEYFFNLEEVADAHHETKTGSFKNNARLKKIWICASRPVVSKFGTVTYEAIREHFPVSQLTYMHLENVIPDTLNVEEIPDLEVLRVIFGVYDLQSEIGCRLPSLDLSKNKKLKEVEFGNIMPEKLDLTKNQKMDTVKVYAGRYGQGKMYKRYPCKLYYAYYLPNYLPEKDRKCKILFAKENQIKTLYYFTGDKQIDITRLSKLEDFQSLKKIKAKVKSSWVRKTFTKKKRGCLIVKNGKVVKKIKAVKKKKFMLI